MIKLIFISSTSACFEWQNTRPYYTERNYEVILNGVSQFVANTNVFSLFNLKPATQYVVEINDTAIKLQFETPAETCCFDVADFGAKGDGVTDDTRAIQNAIHCLPKRGRLLFKKGTYLVSPICLKSEITVELCADATLIGRTERDCYPLIPGEIKDVETGEMHQVGAWEGEPTTMHQSLVFGEHLHDVYVVGQGTIDGNAQNSDWWVDVKNQPYGRPRLVFLNRCTNIYFHGITGKNSASWQFHPYFCQNINFYGVSVLAPKDSPNTDAIDPESCDNVHIVGCRFSVGDDCIGIKSCKMYLGQKYKTPANHHTIRNCYMRYGHGAITLGSENAGGVQNLTVNRCIFDSTDRGLRIKTRRGRGKYAIIDGITFENIYMNHVLTPIVINMWYNCCDPDRYSEYNTTREKLPVDDRTPHLGRFHFKDMVCENCHVAACYCDGLPEQPIDEIVIENIKFSYSHNATHGGVPAMQNNPKVLCRAGMYFDNVSKLRIRNVELEGVKGDAVVKNNVADYKEEQCTSK